MAPDQVGDEPDQVTLRTAHSWASRAAELRAVEVEAAASPAH